MERDILVKSNTKLPWHKLKKLTSKQAQKHQQPQDLPVCGTVINVGVTFLITGT